LDTNNKAGKNDITCKEKKKKTKAWHATKIKGQKYK
jgi:hypothetical protein